MGVRLVFICNPGIYPAMHSAPFSVCQVVLKDGVGLNARLAYGVFIVLVKIPEGGASYKKGPRGK